MSRYLPVFAALLLGLAACSKLSLANYERIKVGMPYKEVVSLLGEPTACDDIMLARSCRWGESPRSVSVNFVADKAVVFSAEGLR